MRSPRDVLRLFIRASFKAVGSQGGALMGGVLGAHLGGAHGAVAGALAGDFLSNCAGELTSSFWRIWGEGHDEETLRAELEQLSGAMGDLSAQINELVAEEGGGQPAGVRNTVAALAAQLPGSLRASQRRPADPSGRTLVKGLPLRGPDDLQALLPTRLPHFRPGPLAGTDWELVELLGIGGFGEVWRARKRSVGREAALKFCLDAKAAKTLKNEVELLRRVQREGVHPGVVRLLDTALNAEPPFLEYEYVPGGDLAGLLLGRRGRGVGAGPAARLVLQLADIVAHAHGRNIVHRDLKPANVLTPTVKGKVRLKVADFGIGCVLAAEGLARSRTLRTTGLTMLARGAYTPLYAPEQQVRGGDPDKRDDVYALGVIWFQLATGNLDMTALPADWYDDARERGMPEGQVELLERCLSGKAEKRPADAKELAEALRGQLAGPTLPEPGPDGNAWQGPALAIGLACVGLLALGLCIWMGRGGGRQGAGVPDTVEVGGQPGARSQVKGSGKGEVKKAPVEGFGNPAREKDAADVAGKGAGAAKVAGSGVTSGGGARPPSGRSLPAAPITNSIGMKLAPIPAGTFWRGSKPNEVGAFNDECPQKQIRITRPFHLGAYEVTQGQYRLVTNDNPAANKAGDDYPVERVSWDDAVAFCRKLSEMPGEKAAGRSYRLPTEAEWEYACRAGTSTRYYTGDSAEDLDRAGWYDENSGGKIHPVGEKVPNAWGLYDMHGNVYEWCADWYDARSYELPDIEDPQGSKDGSARVLRGGSWFYVARGCSAPRRKLDSPGIRDDVIGFRVVCVPSARTP